MNWVLPLVGCGGPAVSRCGHETRRHRIYGALFASVFASVLLAACGGGSGGNLTTSSETEPGPPGTGHLTATGDGDGQGSESENEQQQQKIIVNQEEEQQQEIVVNIQPDPEESESEEEEEQQQQQLTIIEEEDIPYVEQEEEEPRYSAATQTQTQATNGLNIPDGLNIGKEITDKYRVKTTLQGQFPAGLTGGGGFPYGLEASERFIDNKIRFLTLSTFLSPKYRPGNYTPHKTDHNLTYEREDGFKGVYIYEGETGELTGDVELGLTFSSNLIYVAGSISTDLEIEGEDLSGIIVVSTIDSTTGVGGSLESSSFSANPYVKFGSYDLSGQTFTQPKTMDNQGQAKLTMVLSPDARPGRGSAGGALSQPESYPSLIAGGVEINGFKIKATDRDTNTLVGAFIGDNQEIPPRKIRKSIQGSIGMFSYGIWAKEDFDNNYIRFLKETTKFNPERTASDYTSHTTPNEAVFYKRENGFKGAYIYEGETGELTGDVELGLNFSANAIYLVGSISTDLEIEGHDLEGIGVTSTIDSTTGVGGSLEPSSLLGNPYVRFGDYNISDFSFSGATVNHQGQAKLRMALSSDGIQAQGSTPETYPSQIAGEVEINGFKIKESDGDTNTVVGVFVADKQE